MFTETMLTFGDYTMRAVCAELGVEMVPFDSQTQRALPTNLGDLHPLQRLKGRIVYPVRHEFTAPVSAPACAATARPRATSPPPAEAHRSIIKQYIDDQARPL